MSLWYLPAAVSAALRVRARAVEVDHHDRLVPDDPAVVAAGDRQHVPRAGDALGAVVHADAQATAHLVLEMLDLAAVGAG